MPTKNDNPYQEQVERVLPRLLALYDTDRTSPTFGMGDRYHWAWKLIDFGNGTFQGAAHGLSRLLAAAALPTVLSADAVLERIDAMFSGTVSLTRRNGSLEEAFPYESSFCVTALVAYDLLSALELLHDRIENVQRSRWIDVVRPLIGFLQRADEHHAFISNHLATAVAALLKWTALTGEPGADRGKVLLHRILAGQSAEGWFREYDGADPGYQTLCLYYLVDVHLAHPELNLLEPLRRSIQFLWYFAHPDGSFGGHYGSRNTRFYYPAGIEAMSAEVPEAATLASAMRRSIAENSTVTLETMDEPNLIPMFNSYCWAAVLLRNARAPEREQALPPLPFHGAGIWRKQFASAGLIVDKGSNHYCVVSCHKGGVCYYFTLDGKHRTIDTGVVIRSTAGALYSTQSYQRTNELLMNKDGITITTSFSTMRKKLPGPLQFAMLRLMTVTILRIPFMMRLIKNLLVRMLITGKTTIPVQNRRTIQLGRELIISDELMKGAGYQQVSVSHPFNPIHMASQGYWQKQDDEQ